MKNIFIESCTLVYCYYYSKYKIMWGKQSIIKESTFFGGKSIFETLKNSLFGKIKDIIKNLTKDNTAELEQYKLPKVIVIGNESTGKSSLLENITKCQLFPRHSSLCTKAPIHLILNNGDPKYVVKYINPEENIDMVAEIIDKKEIYKKISEIMNSIPSDNIYEYEIIIEMTDHDLPRFDFFDLPGIRSYPPKMAEITTNICKKYLSNKDSIVLCVVPANVTRLTSCQSIALITEMQMEHNCILALTMADRLQKANIEDLLIKRILQTSDEMINLHFAGCISVVNRLHIDECSLEENDNIESKWFNDNILQYIPTEYAEQKLNIEKNITVSNLLQKMDELYNKFIHTDWKPRIMEKITADTMAVQNEINALGEESISNIQLAQLLKEFINSKMIPEFVEKNIHSHTNGCQYTEVAQFNVYYESQMMLDTMIKNINNDQELVNNIIAHIEKNFFETNESNAALKLNRFDDAKADMKARIYTIYEELISQATLRISVATKNYLDRVYMDGIIFTPDVIKNKYTDMFNLLITNKLLSQHDFIDTCKTKMCTENESHKLTRENLIKRLQILKNYRDNINNI